MASAAYDELVTVATVGLSRRQLPLSANPDEETAAADPADALLEAAARQAVARRAGMRPAGGITAPPPMPDDRAAELPARAGHLLRRVTSDAELLAELLTVAAEAGYAAPAPLLPALLDAAVRTVALRPAVIAALGSRGRWLAAHRGDWQRVIDASTIDTGSLTGGSVSGGSVSGGNAYASEPASGQPAADDPRAWETGTRAERVTYLAALRDGNPLVAREVLASGWARESAEERAQLLAVLARGLSGDDEPFLETALDDRSAGVRAAARRLLAALPGSAFNERATLRAGQLLHLRSTGNRHWLEAASPDQVMARPSFAPGDLARDGIAAATPGPGIGAGAWLLTQLIAAVPLDEWTRQWGLDATQVTSLPIEGGPHVEVIAGWRLATVSQRNAAWAAALLSGTGPLLAPGRPQAAWPGNHELAALLDPATRAGLAFGVFTRVGLAAKAMEDTTAAKAATAAIAEWAAWPGPWPDALAEAVLGAVQPSITTQGTVRTLQGLLAAAARQIPVTGPRDYAAEFAALAQSPACAFPWLSVLRRTADTLTLRRAFHAALTAEPLAARDITSVH